MPQGAGESAPGLASPGLAASRPPPADWKISEGAHLAESDSPFGIVSIGDTGVTSYAYPGGLKLAVINPQ